MTCARWLPTAAGAVAVGAVLAAAGSACSSGGDAPGPATSSQFTTTISSSPASATPSPAPQSRAEAVREWKTRAGEHFNESAAALQQVAEASSDEDETGLRSGCELLHDTNSIGLQADLPTPDPRLTAELQRMIDDMNTATHACLRFALGRNPEDAANYRVYLSRAVEHLQRAKLILSAAEK